MTEDGGGLELNIFSSPAAPQPIRKKKRSSGKAWDKKKKTRPLPLDSIHDGAAQLGKTAQPPASGSEDGVDARHRETRQSPQTESSGSTTVGTVKPHQQHEKDERSNDRQRLATTGRAAGSHSTITAGAVGSAGTASGGRKSELSSTAAKKSSHPDGNNNGSHKSAASSIDKEPSYERRRVLEMAGRAPAVTLQGSPDDGATATAKRTNNKMTAAGSTNAEDKKKSAKKRKRKSEPVVANGVIDFTVGNTDHDKPQSNKNVRRAASAAAAVAKATAKMQEAGVHKWWDDDDDDHVSTLAASKVAKPPPAAAGRWRGQWGGTVVDAPEEDKDGGLPSKVHPNSVRTKAVDMGAEASNAMGILTALLGPSDGGSGGGTEPRLKNGGKSKKRAREEGPPVISEADRETVASPIGRDGDDIPIGGSVPPFPGVAKGGKEATASGRALTAEPVQQQGTRDARTTSTAAVASNGDGDGPGTTATREPSDGLDDGGFCDDQTTAGTGVITRKTRGKHERDGDAAHSTAPLPEHHARPRELSRRAAATPLASARSGHVMAAGPGATFAALGLPPKMVAHLVEPKGESGGGGMGLVGPTVCQLAAIPTLAAGHNTVVKSETGSGKTLTYLLPLLCDLAAREPRVERENGTLAIVLAPTRELCAQILEVLTRVVRPFIWLVPGSISGGERRKSEKARLRKGVTVLVCTPGRLLDHLKTTQCFRRESLRWLVLDEADRLLDMGFEKQIKEIVELLDQSAKAVRSGPAGGSRVQGGVVAPSVKVIRRQTVMVSATITKGVSRMAAALLSKHMRVDADESFVESIDECGEATLVSGTRGKSKSRNNTLAIPGGGVHSAEGTTMDSATAEEFSTPRQLVQHYMTVTQKLRLPALCAFLRTRSRNKVVVFMSTCDAVDFHHGLFSRAAWPGDASHPPASDDGGRGDGQGEENGGEKNGRSEKSAAAGVGVSKGDSGGGVGGFFGVGCLVMRLHGNVPQVERQATYRAFHAAASGVLVCTDVAARGLDLPTVDWIVQYDPPAETADYVHRVGRTARKGERGHSLLFLLPREAAYLGVLEARGLRPKPLSLEGVLCAADAGKRDARRADEQLAYELQQGLQILVAGDKTLLHRARLAFQSHVRAYAARAPDSRAVFQVRSLHLGHVARSFALKDPPTAVKVGKRVVSRPGDGVRKNGRGVAGGKPHHQQQEGTGNDVGGAGEEGRRRRDGGGGAGGGVWRLGLSKQTERASRAEFL